MVFVCVSALVLVVDSTLALGEICPPRPHKDKERDEASQGEKL